jgi:predicted dehydrogenase
VNGDNVCLSRRRFFATAVSAVPGLAGFAAERIRIAVIGVHGRGRDHIAAFQGLRNVEVALLCDPDEKVLRERAGQFHRRYGREPETCVDLRRVLERKDIDAVSIATPNHWHALAAIWACQAGKDVYVEKPAAHTIFEGRKLVEAARKYRRIVQHGVQLRSSLALQEAVALLRQGVIGEVRSARGMVYRSRHSIGRKPDEPSPPAGLHYDLWLGPAPERQFNANIVHYNWHWRWAYGDGEIGNQGIHETDMCLWGLGVDSLPVHVHATGDRYWDDDKETPGILDARYDFATGQTAAIEVRPWTHGATEGIPVGNIFTGKDGVMLVKGYDEFKVLLGPRREPGPHGKAGGNHFANFIEAMRRRDPAAQNGPVETAHRASGLAHLANISYRLGRPLKFDPAAERFPGDAEAAVMLSRTYRAPFVVPQNI